MHAVNVDEQRDGRDGKNDDREQLISFRELVLAIVIKYDVKYGVARVMQHVTTYPMEHNRARVMKSTALQHYTHVITAHQ